MAMAVVMHVLLVAMTFGAVSPGPGTSASQSRFRPMRKVPTMTPAMKLIPGRTTAAIGPKNASVNRI